MTLLDDLFQDQQEQAPIVVILDDVFAAVAACSDVVKGVRELDALGGGIWWDMAREYYDASP